MGTLMPPPHCGQAGRTSPARPPAPSRAVPGYASPGTAPGRAGAAGRGYGRAGTCWSAQVLPSGSLKVTNEPHG